MEVSKKQIADGVSAFIDNCLIPSSDGQMRLVLTMTKDSIRKGSALDYFLENPMIENVITEENDMYDITRFVQVMKDVYEDSDYYPITIPSIPLISPQERILKITEPHFDKLIHYIMPETPSATAAMDDE
jgi:hypothetical protein